MKISKSTVQSIERCPWKGDISIDRSSFDWRGAYDTIDGKEYHSVYCAADGPNPDGETCHHNWIGWWSDIPSIEEANEFAVRLQEKIKLITGFDAPIYALYEDKNEHARWCMHEASVRPKGTHPEELPTDISAYACRKEN